MTLGQVVRASIHQASLDHNERILVDRVHAYAHRRDRLALSSADRLAHLLNRSSKKETRHGKHTSPVH